uniref:Uncharacterized protein n=1 Tax=Cannabis sativa TaxID=3483 RepID=A0A803QDM3_CANSA
MASMGRPASEHFRVGQLAPGRCMADQHVPGRPLKNDVDVTFLNYDSNFFDCYLKFEDEPSFHIKSFYGAPNINNRSTSWTLLKRLADVGPLSPWLAIGDFNEILSNSNKSGDIDEAALSTTLQCIPTLVTDEDNDTLSRTFMLTEVEAALKSTVADKSPSVDGMSAMFY